MKCLFGRLDVFVFLLGTLAVRCSCYAINLDPNLKTCFFEHLNVTESFGINYELIPEAGGINAGKKFVDLEVASSERAQHVGINVRLDLWASRQ
jgi:hypothetical protein